MNNGNITNLIKGFMQMDDISLVTSGEPFINYSPSKSLSLGSNSSCISFDGGSTLFQTNFTNLDGPSNIMRINESSIAVYGYYPGTAKNAASQEVLKIDLPVNPTVGITTTGLSSSIIYKPLGQDVINILCNSDGNTVNQYFTTWNINSNVINFSASKVTYNNKTVNWLQIDQNKSDISSIMSLITGTSSTSIQSQINTIVSTVSSNQTYVSDGLSYLQKQINGLNYPGTAINPTIQDQLNDIYSKINSISGLPQYLYLGVLYGRIPVGGDSPTNQKLEIYGGTDAQSAEVRGVSTYPVTINGLEIKQVTSSESGINKTFTAINSEYSITINGSTFDSNGMSTNAIKNTPITNCTISYDESWNGEAIVGSTSYPTTMSSIQSISGASVNGNPIQVGDTCGMTLGNVSSINMCTTGTIMQLTTSNNGPLNSVFNIPAYYNSAQVEKLPYGIQGGFVMPADVGKNNSMLYKWRDIANAKHVAGDSYVQTFIPIQHGEIGYFTNNASGNNASATSYVYMDEVFNSTTFTKRIAFPEVVPTTGSDKGNDHTFEYSQHTSIFPGLIDADATTISTIVPFSVTAIAADGIYAPTILCNRFQSLNGQDSYSGRNINFNLDKSANDDINVTLSCLNVGAYLAGTSAITDASITITPNVTVNGTKGKLFIGDNSIATNSYNTLVYNPGIVFAGYHHDTAKGIMVGNPLTDLAIYGQGEQDDKLRLDKLCFNTDSTYITSKGVLNILGQQNETDASRIILGGPNKNSQTIISTVARDGNVDLEMGGVQCTSINSPVNNSVTPISICGFPLFIQISTTVFNDLNQFAVPLQGSKDAQVSNPTGDIIQSFVLRKLIQNGRIYKIYAKPEQQSNPQSASGKIQYTKDNTVHIVKWSFDGVQSINTGYYVDMTNYIQLDGDSTENVSITVSNFDGTKEIINSVSTDKTDSYSKIYDIKYSAATLESKGNYSDIIFIIGVPFM